MTACVSRDVDLEVYPGGDLPPRPQRETPRRNARSLPGKRVSWASGDHDLIVRTRPADHLAQRSLVAVRPVGCLAIMWSLFARIFRRSEPTSSSPPEADVDHVEWPMLPDLLDLIRDERLAARQEIQSADARAGATLTQPALSYSRPRLRWRTTISGRVSGRRGCSRGPGARSCCQWMGWKKKPCAWNGWSAPVRFVTAQTRTSPTSTSVRPAASPRGRAVASRSCGPRRTSRCPAGPVACARRRMGWLGRRQRRSARLAGEWRAGRSRGVPAAREVAPLDRHRGAGPDRWA